MWSLPVSVILKPIRNKNNDETSRNEEIKLGLNETDEKLGSLVNLGVGAIIFGFFILIHTNQHNYFSGHQCGGSPMKFVNGINRGSETQRNDDKNLVC